MSQEEIRQLQPDIAMNDRQHGDGDLITSKYECHLPPERLDHAWEHPYCMTGNGAFWGYTQPLECLPAKTMPAKSSRRPEMHQMKAPFAPDDYCPSEPNGA